MSDAQHDIEKLKQWSKKYLFRVKCCGCGITLASEDKEEGYCRKCYEKVMGKGDGKMTLTKKQEKIILEALMKKINKAPIKELEEALEFLEKCFLKSDWKMKLTKDDKNICKRCGRDYEIYGENGICDDCSIQDDDKLKEVILNYYKDNAPMAEFLNYIIKKAREGYVKKEEFVEQKCKEIDAKIDLKQHNGAGRSEAHRLGFNGELEEAKKIIGQQDE